MAHLRAIVLSMAWLCLATAEARADKLLVVASTMPTLAVGNLIDGARALTVPPGTSVTVISQSGRTTTLSGPFAGKPGDGEGASDPDLLSELQRLLTAPTEVALIGSVRANPLGEPDDPWAMDVSRSGSHCIRAEGRPNLWRPSAEKATSLSLKLRSPRQKVTVHWPRGAATVAWPEELPLLPDVVYVARLKGGKTAKLLQLSVVPDGLPSEAHRAAWMAKAGCEVQAKKLLTSLR